MRLTMKASTSFLGRNITERMMQLRISDRELAELCNISYDSVRSIRRNDPNPNPRLDTLLALANALQTTIDALVYPPKKQTFDILLGIGEPE